MKKILFVLFILIEVNCVAQFSYDFEIPRYYSSPPFNLNVSPNNGGCVGFGHNDNYPELTAHSGSYCWKALDINAACYVAGPIMGGPPAFIPQVGLSNRFSFWVKGQGELYRVLLSIPTGNNYFGPNDQTVVLISDTYATSEWRKVQVDLSAYIGQTVYVAIGSYASNNAKLCIDDVVVDSGSVTQNCDSNLNFPLNSNGYYDDLSGTISWTATSGQNPIGYMVTFVKFLNNGNDIIGNTYEVGNVLSYNVGALSPGTKYGVSIEAKYFNSNLICNNYYEFTTTPIDGPIACSVGIVRNKSCFDSTDSLIAGGVIGGIPPYQFSIDGGITYQNQQNFYNVPVGNYTYVAKDSQNRVSQCGLVTITQPTQITATNIYDNLIVTVSATGGTPPYVYSNDAITYVTSPTFTFNSPQVTAVYVKDANNCVFFNPINVQVTAPLINGSATATISLQAGSTLANITIDGAPNVIWYAVQGTLNVNQNSQNNASDRIFSSPPLPPNTVLVNGATYYATRVINGFESTTRLAVTVNLTGSLSANTDDLENLIFYPNPVQNILTVSNSEKIDEITVSSIQGQQVLNEKPDSQLANIDVSSLSTGIYIVKIKSNGKEKNIKISK